MSDDEARLRVAELERERDKWKRNADVVEQAANAWRADTERAEAACAAMRRALERLRSAAVDSSNIKEHDGWHRTDPHIEMPKEVLAEVDAALEANAGRALVARLERYELALAQIEVLDPALTQHAACAAIARAALAGEGEPAEAQAAAMRAALEQVRDLYDGCKHVGEYDGVCAECSSRFMRHVVAALEADAGRVLLERLERLTECVATTRRILLEAHDGDEQPAIVDTLWAGDGLTLLDMCRAALDDEGGDKQSEAEP